MPTSPRSENQEILPQKLQDVARSSSVFDRDLATRVGDRIAVRRSLCGLSQHQLGARLGIDSAGMKAYEKGERRLNCKLLLETAKQLNVALRFFLL